ncbi:MAG: adenine phosphoribosyltransferase [Candidatus Binatia bacterium]|nr:MAG: adenine phosphoribosyltransferase [Candidatus Binatia bacterium]
MEQAVRAPELRRWIRDIPNFPKPGIVFRDVTPLLAHGPAFRSAVDLLASPYKGGVDVVLGIESRGFIFGAAVAYALGAGLVVVRKPGKLPAEKIRAAYELEYGTDALEIHRDAFEGATRVLIVDDLLATGGTASAACELVERLGGEVVACAFVIELTALGGRQRLAPRQVLSLIQY